ncbi:MAG: toxin-antitoxin system YwqK family antitoxin [Saprospiraceae bacterium]|nr:toxin-antitoxin system YwqK family antitoxin [Saprospiraceae bacterium]MBK7360477.1 toxin-antitoxin system YwqK family antitoxin [Saprospiraceae bacterium]MBK7738394.1 toxin-antitoxin system YwqK family antitoxin [Saprospiraceae bacterium]MBK7913033.1 toxin-antitoxin system YwqK family antitoxin [Saprospiraceae bacterium]
MKFPVIFVLTLLLSISCKQLKTVENKNAAGKLIEKYSYKIIEGKELKEGLYEKYDEEGRLLESANYTNGKLNGIRKLYREGKLESEETRVDDKYEGPFKAYHPNGSLQIEANYTNDIMAGDVKVYYPGGQLKEIVRFADNVEDGPFVEYHENGKLKAEGNYKQSDGAVEDGELKLYDTTGTLIKIMNCELGKCFTKWAKDTTAVQ